MFHTAKKRTHKKLHKSGQFTIFVILGLLIFMTFAFEVYVRVRIASTLLTQQADVQLKNYLTNNAINQYVSNCLEAVTDDVFITASMQGGLLNSSNKILNQDYLEYYSPEYNRTFNVSIIIDANNDCPDGRDRSDYIVTQIPGPYPLNCPNNDFVSNLPSLYNRNTDICKTPCTINQFRWYSGFFGVNNLPILCDSDGANRPGIVPGTHTCDYYSNYRESMQQLLQDRISNDINLCVNFTEMLNRIPSNITNIGNVNTTILFSQQGFTVNLEYPFTILMRNKQPVTRLIDFSVSKNIPFKELYEYTYELANYDVKDARFGILANRSNVISNGVSRMGINIYNPYYVINITEGNESNDFTRLVQVTDTMYKIHGIPLTINFGVKNRAPVLDYINNGYSPDYDLVAVENRTITISPQGYDPDDEQLTNYTYGDWLEDYTDYYNFSDEQCATPNNIHYVIENCTKRNETGIPEHNWTVSDPFINTHKIASYTATSSDLGLHTVYIAVEDSHHLYDFQAVRILVFDLPVAIINGSNGYDDVDKDRASYEDLYLLNGAESTVGTIAASTDAIINNFIWNDSYEPFYFNKTYINDTISTKWLALPNDTETPTPAFDIMNITKYIFQSRTDDYTIHNISLTVVTSTGLSNDEIYQVNVTQCLNHSSLDNRWSYPYNRDPTNLIDALNADHTCCTDSMTYATTDTPCYTAERYGMIGSFEVYTSGALSPPEKNDISYEPNPYPNDISDNDIFKQTFTRTCSGDRGNTCTGNATEIRSVETPCDDYNGLAGNTAFNFERCSGPNEYYFNANSATPDNILGCQQYSGYTFEQLSGTGTGQCTGPNPQFAIDMNTWGDTGKYSCDGGCNNGACVPTTCVCQASANNNNDPWCNGIAYPGNVQPTKSCTNGGQSYFADTCSDCQVIDAEIGICKGTDYAPDCTYTSQECRNRPANRQISAGVYCNSNCIYINCAITPYKYDINNGDCYYSCTPANQNINCNSGHTCVGGQCI